MYENDDISQVRTTTTIYEVYSDFCDLEDLPDVKHVFEHAKELIVGNHSEGREDVIRGPKTIDESAWEWFLPTRERLAFLCYVAVKKGLCRRVDLRLGYFLDDEVAAAIVLLLSEYEPALALNPIASNVRRFQLACICEGFWDVLGFDVMEREDRQLDLMHP